MAKHPVRQKASDTNGSQRGCWEEARIFLKDLQEAWPGPNLRTMSLAVPLLAIIWTYRQLPALRVENGSVDHCDPLRTYGEITARGMHTVSRLAPGGVFLDIGSGHGNFVLWALNQGGFNESRGIEVVEERHLAALQKAQEVAAQHAQHAQHVTLRMGDAREHLELFDGTHLVFWNNLCFASETSNLITKAFAERAAKGARLVTLAELEVSSLASLTMRRGEVLVEVDWREEGYLPYVYIRH